MKDISHTLSEIVETFNLHVACGEEYLGREVNAGFSGDLLSDVMGHAQKGDVWVTRQTHPNIVAVAVLRMLSGVIVIDNRQPDLDTIKKAEKEKVPILVSALPAFELVGRLHAFGIPGVHE